MANPGDTDSENSNAPEVSKDQEPNFGAPMPGEDANAKPLASSSLGQAAKTFESKFAARRKRRLEETAASIAGSAEESTPAIRGNNANSEGTDLPDSSDNSIRESSTEGMSDKPLDENTRSFLAKLTDKLSSENAGDDPSLARSRSEGSLAEDRESTGRSISNEINRAKSAEAETTAGGKLNEDVDFGLATRLGSQGTAASEALAKPDLSAASEKPLPTEKAAAVDTSTQRGGFKPRKDLNSYRSLDSKTWHGRESGSSALSGPGGSADAKLFGGMASAPEDLPVEEPQTPEERKKALDALGYKYGTDLPTEVAGGPVESAKPAANDQFTPPPKPSPGSDVGWQSVNHDDEPRQKSAAFVSAKKSPVLSPLEVAARKKEEQDPRVNPPLEKAKPFRGREDEPHVPKNRWGQAPDTATARSIWADQLGINKPSSALRGPSASLRGRLKRVMSSDIFNVRELYSLRGIAAFIVFLAQAQVFAAHGKPAYPVNVIGAQIFFVMSGFVITRWLLVNETGSLQRTLGEFYARRALRIFPMYYLVLGVLMFTGHLPDAESFFCGMFNLKAYEAAKVPPQLLQYWTLCVEIQFYLFFPFLLMITPQKLRMALVVLLTAATGICTYLSTQQTPHAQDWLLLPISGQYIMWGCLAAYMDVKSDIALSLNASMCVVIGILAQAGLHAWLLVYGNIAPADVSDILWKSLSTLNAISLAILIFGLWRTSNAWLRGLCANDVLVYFGKISYGFYLLLPLCFFMQPSIIAVMPILAKVPAIVTSFVITFIMAVVTFHYLQVPINNVREHLPIAR